MCRCLYCRLLDNLLQRSGPALSGHPKLAVDRCNQVDMACNILCLSRVLSSKMYLLGMGSDLKFQRDSKNRQDKVPNFLKDQR